MLVLLAVDDNRLLPAPLSLKLTVLRLDRVKVGELVALGVGSNVEDVDTPGRG
jgi:hypothetical protein